MKTGRFAIALMVVFALIALPLGLYVAGYLWLGERVNWSQQGMGFTEEVPNDLEYIERTYSQQWQMTLYKPAGAVEHWLRGLEVQVTWRDPNLQFITDSISTDRLLKPAEYLGPEQ